MEDFKPVSTTTVIGCKLRKDDESLEADQTRYKSMIGILLYVTMSRKYVIQSIRLVPIFKSTPKEARVQVVKNIFRYLKGALDIGLWYPKGEDFTLIKYIDAYWIGSVDNKNYKWRRIIFGKMSSIMVVQEEIFNLSIHSRS